MARIVVGAAMQSQDTERASYLRKAKVGGLSVGERSEFPCAAFNDVARNMVGESGGFRAGARRIRENVKIGEGTFFDEPHRRGVIVFRFAGKTGEYVGTNGSMRQDVADQFDAARVVFGAVPAVHSGEDAV